MRDDPPAMGRVSAALSGWMLVAAAHAGAIGWRRSKSLDAPTTAVVELYAWGYASLCAAGFVIACAAWSRLLTARRSRSLSARPRTAAIGVIALLSGSVGLTILDIDAAGLAGRLADATGLSYDGLLAVLAFGAGLVVPAALALGFLLRRRWLRLLACAAAIAIGITHSVTLTQGYDGVHLFVPVAAATLAGAALVGARLASPLARLPPRAAPIAAFVSGGLGLFSVVVPPPNRASVELGRQPAAFLAPFPLFPQDDIDVEWQPPAASKPWFTRRDGAAPVPPTGLLSLRDPVVVLIGIDSMRADILTDESHRATLPALFQLRDESVHFIRARSPGTSTAPALASIFSGAYYSQLYWVRHPNRPAEPFPHLDETVRFPEALSSAGVATITTDASGWLLNAFGIVRGFDDEVSLRQAGSTYPRANLLLGPLPGKIARHGRGPVFAFSHLLDAHSPYTSVRTDGTPFQNYLAELGWVDAQIQRLRTDLTRRGIWPRTVLIVYSDHGEAFGEHGLSFHGQSLYEETLRVPLLVRVPGRRAAVVDEPVSLIDLGPTILDLFGLAAPHEAMGQSLVPLLAGADVTLDRPIFAEARLKRALVLRDGTKVIHDPRLRTVEVYDLSVDPDEEHNLYDPDEPRSRDALGALLRFFDVHTYEQPGYRVPYRKW